MFCDSDLYLRFKDTSSSPSAILYTQKCVFVVYAFRTALNLPHDYQPKLRKCSQQILSHAPPAVTSEPGSWLMLATRASAVILLRSHHTRSCTGNSELTSSHLLIIHTHQPGWCKRISPAAFRTLAPAPNPGDLHLSQI